LNNNAYRSDARLATRKTLIDWANGSSSLLTKQFVLHKIEYIHRYSNYPCYQNSINFKIEIKKIFSHLTYKK